MLLSFAFSLLVSAPVSAPVLSPPQDPPIRLRLSEDSYAQGDRARVRVKLAESGYLVVLRVDARGRVRVLYPVDPEDTSAVRGGKEFEIRGRGDRDAFIVDEREGTGTVLAARSATPFDFSEFTRGVHWDYRALEDDSTGGDGESVLLDLVDRMTEGHYDYDVVTYGVATRRVPSYAGWYGPRYYDPWFQPFNRFSLFSPYYPYYGRRFGFGFGVVVGGGHPRAHRRW